MKVQETNQHRNKHRGRLNCLGYCEAARLTARLQGYTVTRLHSSSAREETARWIDNRNGVVTIGSWDTIESKMSKSINLCCAARPFVQEIKVPDQTLTK